jgi:uncharacterized protein Yka (UPF0111/DUF47 family)
VKRVVDRFFGPTADAEISGWLVEMARTCERAAQALKETRCSDVAAIVACEDEGDVLELRIHALLIKTFQLRYFDKRDVEHLAKALDDILDGMRRTVKLVDLYSEYFVGKAYPSEADELLVIIVDMTQKLVKLTTMIQTRNVNIGEMDRLVDHLDSSESRADALRYEAEKYLLETFRPQGPTFEYLAWRELYLQLESITDNAAHCGSLISEIAKK